MAVGEAKALRQETLALFVSALLKKMMEAWRRQAWCSYWTFSCADSTWNAWLDSSPSAFSCWTSLNAAEACEMQEVFQQPKLRMKMSVVDAWKAFFLATNLFQLGWHVWATRVLTLLLSTVSLSTVSPYSTVIFQSGQSRSVAMSLGGSSCKMSAFEGAAAACDKLSLWPENMV